ncbi:hypothetical protein Tiera_053 [Polaromonas phage Tiera]|nr:hypothetical protein Tiera_053 [Polaromonas phage Tiera]
MPANIKASATRNLIATMNPALRPYYDMLCLRDWGFYVTDSARGYCYYAEREITVPLWVIEKGVQGQITQYFAHEMAHAFTSRMHQPHGSEFMANLIKICPAEFLHYEVNYKPRNAKAAGISKCAVMNAFTFKGELPSDF